MLFDGDHLFLGFKLRVNMALNSCIFCIKLAIKTRIKHKIRILFSIDQFYNAINVFQDLAVYKLMVQKEPM